PHVLAAGRRAPRRAARAGLVVPVLLLPADGLLHPAAHPRRARRVRGAVAAARPVFVDLRDHGGGGAAVVGAGGPGGAGPDRAGAEPLLRAVPDRVLSAVPAGGGRAGHGPGVLRLAERLQLLRGGGVLGPH